MLRKYVNFPAILDTYTILTKNKIQNLFSSKLEKQTQIYISKLIRCISKSNQGDVFFLFWFLIFTVVPEQIYFCHVRARCVNADDGG